MSFMHMDATTAATTEPTVVTLTGGTAGDTDSNFARGGWIFRADGTVDRVIGFSEIQYVSATNWIIPNSEASIDYQIRAHLNPPGSTPGPSALDTFLTLDSDREWVNACTRFCLQTTELVIDIRFQDGSDTSINNVSSLFDSANVMASRLYFIALEAS